MGHRGLILVALAACRAAPAPHPGIAIAAPATAVVAPKTAARAPAVHPLSDAAKACLAAAAPASDKCLAGDERSCYFAGAASHGDCRVTLLDHACAAEEAMACADRGGEIVAAEPPSTPGARGLELLARGCDLGSGKACTLLGGEYDRDPALVPAGSTSAALYARACGVGHPIGCRKAGELEPDRDKASPLLQRACERGDARGCVDYTAFLALRGGADDIANAKKILGHTCQQDDDASDQGEACARLRVYSPDAPVPEQER